MHLQREIRWPFGPWWLLWSVLLSAVWLIPNFSLPWLTFDRELLAAVSVLLLALALCAKSKGSWVVPWIAVVPLVLTVVPILQWLIKVLYFGGDAWTACLYLLGFSLSIVIGLRAEKTFSDDWFDALMLAIGVGAILSVGAALYQWLGLEGLSVWVIDLPPGFRPSGNIGQANLVATVMCWGLAALWWGYATHRIRGWIVFFSAVYLLFGIAMTQSRTGWVFVGALVPIAAVTYRGPLKACRYLPALIALLGCFVVMVLSWTWLNRALHIGDVVSVHDRLTMPGYRLGHWREISAAIALRPLFGWGWNQIGVAQQAVAGSLPPLPELIQYSHNLVLDLVVWNGLPIGIVVSGLLAFWFFSTTLGVDSAKAVIALLMVSGIITHAMLEYPHAYMFMLLPAGLLIGTLEASRIAHACIVIPRAGIVAIFIAAGVLMAWTTIDYWAAKTSLDRLRFEAARVGPSRNSAPPNLTLLSDLEALLTVDRMKMVDSLPADRLELMRKTAERFPVDALMFRYAVAAAGSGNPKEASNVLIRICKLYPEERCDLARRAWREFGEAGYPALKAIPFPDLDAKHGTIAPMTPSPGQERRASEVVR